MRMLGDLELWSSCTVRIVNSVMVCFCGVLLSQTSEEDFEIV